MNENLQTQNEEEISLLDLFTVLLRYRKLIAGIIVLFIVLSIAGYFVYPVYQYKRKISVLNKQGTMQLEIEPKARMYVSQNIDSFILRPDIIYESLYTAGMKKFTYKGGKISLDDENKTMVMYLIDMFWIKNTSLSGDILFQKDQDKIFNVKRTGENTNINQNPVFEVTFKNNDSELIIKFMESIYKLCTLRVQESLQPSAQMTVSNYERLINLPHASESIKMIIEKDYDSYIFLKNFLDGKEAVVKMVSEPLIVEDFVSLSFYKAQYFKTGIIVVFAGIFLAIMLAFVLNVIRSVKSDETAMEKIRDALGNLGGK
ncbi:MAG: hypothetical protein LBV17_08240 [Treponema sp.]|jgi:hypothetical protein|nr:hypothetical protein [Treponema sp.]